MHTVQFTSDINKKFQLELIDPQSFTFLIDQLKESEIKINYKKKIRKSSQIYILLLYNYTVYFVYLEHTQIQVQISLD